MPEPEPADHPYLGPVAVIGAGMAGLTCAAALAGAGIAVEIFEKSTGIGGRLATRPVGDVAVDIGAQYVTARGQAFRAVVKRLNADGNAAPWQPDMRDIRLDDDAIDRRDPWFVGTPDMSDLAVQPAPPGAVHGGSKVTGLDRRVEGWFLTLDPPGTAGPFSAVAVTPPAPQCLALVGGLDPVFQPIAEVGMSPCWTVACVFERPVAIEIDVLRPSRGAISWAARNSAKPARDRTHDAWVIHGDPVWSLDHLEDGPETVRKALLDAFAQAAGTPLPKTAAVKTHRWRYARVESPIGESHLLGCDGTLGVAGDWCLGARVEAAFDSGRALGQALADRLRAHHPEID